MQDLKTKAETGSPIAIAEYLMAALNEGDEVHIEHAKSLAKKKVNECKRAVQLLESLYVDAPPVLPVDRYPTGPVPWVSPRRHPWQDDVWVRWGDTTGTPLWPAHTITCEVEQ